MSAWINLAEAMRARIAALQVMVGVEVLVDRQLSIDSVVAQAVGKAKGACVTILFEGAEIEGDIEIATYPRFSVRVYTRPIIRDGVAAAADDLLEAIIGALQFWSPTPGAHLHDCLRLIDGPLILPDKNYLIYEATFKGRTILPLPVF